MEQQMVLDTVIENALENALSYSEYREKVARLFNRGLVTGEEQSETYLNFTSLNERRMKRWEKTLKISTETREKLQNLNSPVTWLVISEGWCGDAAHSLPAMYKIAEETDKISLKVVIRDEFPELMDKFLTGGTRSIPKLVQLNQDGEVTGEWGPRPLPATNMVREYKELHGKLTPEFKEELQVWYNKDKGQSILNELVDLLPH